MARRPLEGYPTSWGNIRASVAPHVGPNPYVAYVKSPAAGDTVTAREFGLKYLDMVHGGMTDSGTYTVRAVPLDGHPSDNQVAAPATSYGLVWYVVASGAEVAPGVDLSAQIVRLLGIGPK